MERSASSLRPRRMSHHGDSGAKKRMTMRGVCMKVMSASVDQRRTGWAAYREDPLQGERRTPSPFIITLVVAKSSASNDDGANGPGHLQSSSAGTSKGERNDLGCVGGTNGNEESPRDTLQCLSNGKDLE